MHSLRGASDVRTPELAGIAVKLIYTGTVRFYATYNSMLSHGIPVFLASAHFYASIDLSEGYISQQHITSFRLCIAQLYSPAYFILSRITCLQKQNYCHKTCFPLPDTVMRFRLEPTFEFYSLGQNIFRRHHEILFAPKQGQVYVIGKVFDGDELGSTFLEIWAWSWLWIGLASIIPASCLFFLVVIVFALFFVWLLVGLLAGSLDCEGTRMIYDGSIFSPIRYKWQQSISTGMCHCCAAVAATINCIVGTSFTESITKK
eukprot:gene4991-9979_t